MSTTLITSKDKKGVHAVRLFEDAYNGMNLDEDRAQRLNEHPEFVPQLKKLIDELSRPKPVIQDPPIDEWFDLEVDNTGNPMDVVTTAGYDAKGWEYLGPPVEGKSTRRIKLVWLGHVDLEAARRSAKARGYRLVEGQAREPLKAKFPRHNGRPIVFGRNEWQNPLGYRGVTCLRGLGAGDWRSDFRWSRVDFYGRCLWAVGQDA